jgi:hypothetical protein
MSGLNNNIVWLALAAAVAGAQAEEPKVAPLGNNQVAATTQAATQRLMVSVDTTLVAQAAPPESDGKPPKTVMVKQVDGSMKPVSYFRDKQWAIIPPPVADGKLVDGSLAPSHPIRALNAQVKILVPYDKNVQIARAVLWDKDIIWEAVKYSQQFKDKVEKWWLVTKNDIELLLFHWYIMRETWWKYESVISVAQTISMWSLKMTSTQFEEMRSNAEQKAKRIWKATTGAVA